MIDAISFRIRIGKFNSLTAPALLNHLPNNQSSNTQNTSMTHQTLTLGYSIFIFYIYLSQLVLLSDIDWSKDKNSVYALPPDPIDFLPSHSHRVYLPIMALIMKACKAILNFLHDRIKSPINLIKIYKHFRYRYNQSDTIFYKMFHKSLLWLAVLNLIL